MSYIYRRSLHQDAKTSVRAEEGVQTVHELHLGLRQLPQLPALARQTCIHNQFDGCPCTLQKVVHVERHLKREEILIV